MTAAADLPVATIVAYPGLDGVYLKHRHWTLLTDRGARGAEDREVDDALAGGATVLRTGA